MNLADIYSFIDSKKRAVKGLLAEPGLTLQQYMSQIGEDNDKRLNLQANAYPMAGDKTVLNSPHQLDQFRAQLAKEGGEMAMAGMFVGKGSKTWDELSASKALQLEKSGADARKIWSETGTWKAPDGMWRQEIDDSAAKITAGNISADQMRVVNGGDWITGKDFLSKHYQTPEAKAIRTRASMRNGGLLNDDTPKLFNTMNHGSLENSYPELSKIRVAIDDKMAIGNAAYAEGSNAIVLSPMQDKDALSAKLHELQHAVQQREGFARGGGPDEFGQQDVAIKARDMLNWQREVSSRLKKNPSLDWQSAEAMAAKEYEAIGWPEAIPSPEIRKMAHNPLEYFESQPEDFVKLYGLDKKTTPHTSNELYRRLAGEAEARATQTRIPLDAAQRRATFPEDSYDTPIGQLIMRFQSQ